MVFLIEGPANNAMQRIAKAPADAERYKHEK